MDESLLELVELANGDVALKRVDGDEKPLLEIRFSEESQLALSEMKMIIARAMVEAGVQAFSDLSSMVESEEDVSSFIVH